jgi:hypothetical protein
MGLVMTIADEEGVVQGCIGLDGYDLSKPLAKLDVMCRIQEIVDGYEWRQKAEAERAEAHRRMFDGARHGAIVLGGAGTPGEVGDTGAPGVESTATA